MLLGLSGMAPMMVRRETKHAKMPPNSFQTIFSKEFSTKVLFFSQPKHEVGHEFERGAHRAFWRWLWGPISVLREFPVCRPWKGVAGWVTVEVINSSGGCL